MSSLSRCGWESLKVFFHETLPVEDPVLGGEEDAVPGAVVAMRSLGDFLGFNPHLHVLCSETPTAHIDYAARPGATRLPVAVQTMHYSKRDFLHIQCWLSVWARDSQLPPYEDYLYSDPDYPIEMK